MVELKEKRLRKSLSEAKNHWQGQKDSNPRHAVLEWMWENALGSRGGAVFPGFSSKSVRGWCWFGAMEIFRGPQKAENPRKALTIVPDLSKEICPFPDNLIAAGLDDLHDIPQGALRDAGVVVAQVALAGSGDPNLRGVGVGCALADVDMDGFQRVTLIGPEEHPVGADLKDLRHGQILPPGRTPKSNGRWIRSPSDSVPSPPG